MRCIRVKNKNGRQSHDYLPLSTLDEQELQNLKGDLEALFSLKTLLISQGLMDKNSFSFM
jgi:hypothetical protein